MMELEGGHRNSRIIGHNVIFVNLVLGREIVIIVIEIV